MPSPRLRLFSRALTGMLLAIAATVLAPLNATAATDTTPPTVTVNAPSSSGPGTTYMSGTAMDVDSGIMSLRVDFSGPTSGSTLGIPVIAGAWSYTWNTSLLPDGMYMYAVTATDYAGNSAVANRSVLVDNTAPTGGSISYAGGVSTATTAVVAFVRGMDAGSGISVVQLQRSQAPVINGQCQTSQFSAWQQIGPNNPISPFTDASVKTDTCYMYALAVVDASGNTSWYSNANILSIAVAGPAITVTSPTSTAIRGTTTISGTIDNAGGVSSSSITFTGASSGTVCTPYAGTPSYSCSWNTGALADGTYVLSITAANSAGAATTITRTVLVDNTAPAGGNLSYSQDFINLLTVALTVTPGMDTGSGVASFELQRASAGLTNGTCGAFTSFVPVAVRPSSPWTDTTITAGACYAYQLVVTDTAGNSALTSSPNVVKVDTAAPVGTIDAPSATQIGGIATTSGTAQDAHSGIRSVIVSYSGPASGTICSLNAPTSSWSCAWNTAGIPDGTYTIVLTLTDAATNTSTTSRSVTVSNTPFDACSNLYGQQLTVPVGMIAVSGVCMGTSADNVLSGTTGKDSIDGGGGNDTLSGMSGDDTLIGNTGNDTIDGNFGNDTIIGGEGTDKLNGGAANDTIDANDGTGTDRVDCGDGIDNATINKGDTVVNCEKVTVK